MTIKHTDTKDFGSPIQTDDYYESTQRKTYKEALDEFAEKHSEMMAPWAYNDYHEMEHWYPDPDPKPWTWDWNPRQPPGSRIDIDYFDPSGADPTRSGGEELCVLPCDGAEVDDCSGVFECDAEDLGVDFYDVRVVDGHRWVADIWWEGDSIGAPKTMIKIRWESGAPTGSEVRINAYTRTLFGKRIMAVGGHICTALITLNCCDATTALSFDDDSTADTIAQNSSITLYTLGSGAPFEWSVSGTGFSLGSSKTIGNTNTLIAGGSACGMANITVTDCADESVSFSIRCTAGQWVEKSTDCVLSASVEHYDQSGSPVSWYAYEYISGYQKQHQVTNVYRDHHVGCDEECCPPQCAGWYANNPCADETPNCIDGEHNGIPGIDYCTTDGWDCTYQAACMGGLSYSEWECA